MFELGGDDDEFGVQDTIGEADKGVRGGTQTILQMALTG